MIKLNNLCQDKPYLIFKDKYYQALGANQMNIEAVSIASFNNISKEVDSRFVNLKFINGNEFIFFSNYNSPKSLAFNSHNQISALFFWSSINIQIRIKANITKTPRKFNLEYFIKRDKKKNALAICSDQSKPTQSYEDVQRKFKKSLDLDNLQDCPEYWGGYSFIPYYFEFWKGHESRLNKREIYEMKNNCWDEYILEP
mgnify:CR=1 FL=1